MMKYSLSISRAVMSPSAFYPAVFVRHASDSAITNTLTDEVRNKD